MARKLFCEISPFTYRLSVLKCIAVRNIKNIKLRKHFAKQKSPEELPYLIYKHSSIIRRKLANVDETLQENKAVNLSLSTKKVTGILIKPGEVFSFWNLVGNVSAKAGYKDGLVISKGHVGKGVGGGLCQFTNLIHWMVLHTPLTITEHHHHDGYDLFPDYNRQIPFGTGTSILYNYLDYRFKNNTDKTYQILVYVTEDELIGEIRADKPQPYRYDIHVENEFFSLENGVVYRNGEVSRETFCVDTGKCIEKEIIRKNHAKVLYDTSGLDVVEIL